MTGVLSSCWKLIERYIHTGVQVGDAINIFSSVNDAFLWHKSLCEFSIAVVQANSFLEDQSQIKVGPYGTLIGIYDGHGGTDAARFISQRLFPKIEHYAAESGGMCTKVLKQALSEVEDEFLNLIEKSWRSKPQILSSGSCCLVGAITETHLYVANLGDSKVVLGTTLESARISDTETTLHTNDTMHSPFIDRLHKIRDQIKQSGMNSPYHQRRNLQQNMSKDDDKMVAVSLSDVHNAAIPAVREELKALHPDEKDIVVMKNNVWRVKGIIQISRSVGDVYLKKPGYNQHPIFTHSRGISNLSIKSPVLSAEPCLTQRTLSPNDRFLIFGSDGLWDFLSDQEAVNIVKKGPPKGIAKRLAQIVMQRAAKKFEMHYSDLRKIEPGNRRYFHDDISVIVVYLDSNLANTPKLSPRKRPITQFVNAPLDMLSNDNYLEDFPLI